MLIVDGHEDLAYNVLADGRDYRLSALVARAAEVGGPVPELNGLCMLGLPEWLEAGVAVVIATITAIPSSSAKPGELAYTDFETAHQHAIAQLDIYRDWAATHPQLTIITNQGQLERVLASWSPAVVAQPDQRQIGFVLLIENADVIRTPDELGYWHAQGVRLVGPAWHTNRYTGSSMEPGPLTDLGRALLREMQQLGMFLDLSHMSDEACLEALDSYAGPIVATHSNPRRLVPILRSLPDDIIQGIVARDGMVGIMPLNWALDPESRRKTKAEISLDVVVDAIDVVCQLSGDALHVGIGSDFDGGQGAEATPAELDTIADLPLLADALSNRGYDAGAIEAIMSGNWLRLLRQHLPMEDARA